MPDEEWRVINGFPRYSVSNLGRVKSRAKVVQREDGDTEYPGGILRASLTQSGRRVVTLYKKPRCPKPHLVSRLVAAAFLGEPPSKGHQVVHLDGDTDNNCAYNLIYATRREAYAIRKSRGGKAWNAGKSSVKLTIEQVDEIRLKYAQGGVKQQQLAIEYGVSSSYISHLINHHRRKDARLV